MGFSAYAEIRALIMTFRASLPNTEAHRNLYKPSGKKNSREFCPCKRMFFKLAEARCRCACPRDSWGLGLESVATWRELVCGFAPLVYGLCLPRIDPRLCGFIGIERRAWIPDAGLRDRGWQQSYRTALTGSSLTTFAGRAQFKDTGQVRTSLTTSAGRAQFKDTAQVRPSLTTFAGRAQF